MEKERDYVSEVKKNLDKKSWDFERKEVLNEAVENLHAKGYSDTEIQDFFKDFFIKEQTNDQMVSNNRRYLDLLDEILKD